MLDGDILGRQQVVLELVSTVEYGRTVAFTSAYRRNGSDETGTFYFTMGPSPYLAAGGVKNVYH
jgi:hypothetical protein